MIERLQFALRGMSRWFMVSLDSFVAHLDVSELEDSDDEAEEPDGAAEDLDDEDLDEEGWVGGVSESSSGS